MYGRKSFKKIFKNLNEPEKFNFTEIGISNVLNEAMAHYQLEPM
jgi:hypothetical protein